MADNIFKTAPHTPAHLFRANTFYMITGATYKKEHLIHSDARKVEWRDAFLKASGMYGWDVIAWVVLDNHYHVISKSPKTSADNLSKFVGSYHKFTSRLWNTSDKTPGRKVWWNYWDTCVRNEKDFLARLKYIFLNPVKHGLVSKPEQYKHGNYNDFIDAYLAGNILQAGGEVNDVQEF
jgi:putative transposase